MKNKRIFGAAVAAAAGIALSVVAFKPANAIPITGQMSTFGVNDLNLEAQTITFISGAPFIAATETGSFSGLGTGGLLTWRNQGTPLNFNSLTTGSDLDCGGGCLFTGTNNGLTVKFNLLTESVSVVGGFLTLFGSGTAFLTGFDPTPGVFSLSSQGGSGLGLTFSSTTLSVPGPVVGAGLPGLVVACIGLLALARRRRQQIA